MLKNKNDTIVSENIALRKKTEDKNKTIKANDDNLRSKFTLLEEKHSKSLATKATIEHN